MGKKSAEQGDAVIAYLNDLLVRDRAALSSLVGNRVPCNDNIVQHPSCQVWQVDTTSWTVGTLGVVNGLLHTIGVDQVVIVHEPSNPHTAVRFERLDEDGRRIHNAKNQRQRSTPEKARRSTEEDSQGS